MDDFLILVDEHDKPWGKLEKDQVHQLGLLHRAFSVFIFNSKGELLLQQRAEGKYHSAGLWTNTCCSHPRYGEELSEAIPRRLEEEMGMKVSTQFIFSFTYKAKFENGLTEHEFDHVYYGVSDELPHPNPAEVSQWKYVSIKSLEADIASSPTQYTAWLKICLPRLTDYLKTSSINESYRISAP
ncbi:isopentenyl-diphosphate Delta-isomerase [Cytophagales bacterium WSM2-2]|nr:isopentenyl-diphosphate Delta-isomerase [Cytophagales bacterium WSM2-2]